MYKTIESDLKLEAIKFYWKTNNVTLTANKYGVSRNTLYEWLELAECSLQDAFSKAKPGKKTITAEEECKKLRMQIKDLLDIYQKTSLELPIDIDMPIVCFKCGSSHVVKNGKVITKEKGLQQMFICRECSYLIYVVIKKTL